MKNKFYISTALPYVNADPHIGFTMELIQADVLARYHRLLGEDVFFVTGTDENASKNVLAAQKAKEDIKKFVDKHAQKFLYLAKLLNISNDDFIRTTEQRHILGAEKLWRACADTGDIYKKKYKGLYCVGCEAFITKKELVDGLCPEHKTEPEEIEEENYFFKLSKYQNQIRKLIESDELKITPVSRKNEMLAFIDQGLEDFSVSRAMFTSNKWGIPVPGDDSQIMYVWFDALTNYINALGYGGDHPRFTEHWQKNDMTVHLVGKGVTRFHAIYWPAMLLSAKLELPKKILVHGYVTVDGEKMSKSIGNVVDPFKVIEKYGVDVTRYFLLREIPSTEDGDFSYKKLEDRYNGDLANGLGNLVQRIVTLIDGKLGGELIYKPALIERNVEEKIKDLFKAYINNLDSFLLHEAAARIWDLISYADGYLEEKRPWAAVKHDEGEFLAIMNNATYILYNVAWMLAPFMPATSDKIFETLGADKTVPTLENYKFLVKKGAPLFPRIQ